MAKTDPKSVKFSRVRMSLFAALRISPPVAGCSGLGSGTFGLSPSPLIAQACDTGREQEAGHAGRMKAYCRQALDLTHLSEQVPTRA